jgi:hypothetical protein
MKAPKPLLNNNMVEFITGPQRLEVYIELEKTLKKI